MTDIDLDLARIEEAAQVVDPALRDSPQFVSEQLCAALGRSVLVKLETANPLGSFKGRGADFLLRSLPRGSTVVCATSGNFGQALAYAARTREIGVHVYVGANINPAKLAKMQSLGARVNVAEGDPAQAARAHAAAHPDHVLAGSQAAIAEGAATIGVELLRAGHLDTVVLPVGGGALVTGVSRWVKEVSPGTRIVGVCPAGAPAMAHSWRAGRAIRAEHTDTIADGLDVREPDPEVVHRMRALVDDVVLVTDSALLAGMRLAALTLGLVIEPSAAAGLAAIAEHDLPGSRFATVLTGTDPRPDLLAQALWHRPAR